MSSEHYIYAGKLEEVQAAGCTAVRLNGHNVALFAAGGQVYAVDNRCPHMGFPLDRGTVQDGILTCHWHHARFDLATGGTFDQFADDVRSFPVDIRDGEVWIDVAAHGDPRAHQRERLEVGLERDLSLVIGKAVIVLLENGDPVEPFRIGLEFGVRYRQGGWGPGLTMLTCFMNMLPYLDAEDRPRALYHGLSAVAANTAGQPPRFPVRPLPGDPTDVATLKRWFRRFIEVRDDEGAERCIISAVRAGAGHRQLADMLFAAATDHRYIQIGHVADFTNKAFEALDTAGWEPELAEVALTSLVPGYAAANRMEESNSWRNPIDLIALLEESFEVLPAALETGRARRSGDWSGRDELVRVLLGEDPAAIAAALLDALRQGATEEQLASAVTYAAALRIARFHTSNEFGDWDTALHTFTFANAIQQGIRRAPSTELLRGVFDAAMSVYLDRFLNVPAARLPEANGHRQPQTLLAELPVLLDRQQQVNEAGELVAAYQYAGGQPERLLALLGKLLLREDRDFHTIQTVEAAFRQYELLKGTPAAVHSLVAAARYLAAHAPTMRAQGQTYQIAFRLHRGDRLFEG
ncbi:MAG: Rieske (2Fe-2S) protein [Chloroflexi bacterium]|nr:Rieske (2Fe-2S) protein [Chloroflexota bacterium]MCI0578559.1 Rieske (2Fe-2S) protein [Chloroflexota bacterium]MCI0645079.1 Rieske (2Fe-2S) protein [Chloroflexota bacterium]MCI0731914.1 Rieske (2Fe-2S) protein [Chloroflexota bacterium]